MLTIEEAMERYHGKAIAVEDMPAINAQLPDCMHISRYDGRVRFKLGHAPASIAAIKDRDENRFKPGQSGNQGNRNHKAKPLQQAFRELLERETEDYDIDRDEHKVKFVKHRKIKVSRLLAKMQMDALQHAFRHGNVNAFSRILSDFRIAAGEIPTQESKIEDKRSNNFDNSSLTDLLKVTSSLLERVQVAVNLKDAPEAEIKTTELKRIDSPIHSNPKDTKGS